MAAKGMSMTLTIIVAAVVILVTALVILTIFSISITPLGSIAEAKNQCSINNKQLCLSTGSVSSTWDLDTMLVGGEKVSCAKTCGNLDSSRACTTVNGVHNWHCD